METSLRISCRNFLRRTDADSLIAEMEEMKGHQDSQMGIDSVRIEDSKELKVLSPSTGIFYAKPTPADNDYVQPGDCISVDETLVSNRSLQDFYASTFTRLELWC